MVYSSLLREGKTEILGRNLVKQTQGETSKGNFLLVSLSFFLASAALPTVTSARPQQTLITKIPVQTRL